MNKILHFYDTVMNPVCNRLLNEIPQHYKYHSLRHTLDVVEMSTWIGHAEGLSEEDMNVLKIAALFHDSGYLITRKEHEQASCVIFRETAAGYDFPEATKLIIEGCILATTIPQRPNNLLERIICDADLDYLGRDDFPEIAEMLFEELMNCGEILSREQWNKIQVDFIGKQVYHTEHSQLARNEKLKMNLQLVKYLNE